MATKSNIKFSFDPVIVLFFSLISLTSCLLTKFIPSLNIGDLFQTPTAASGTTPFIFKEIQSWARLILYIFGTKNLSQWIFIALLFAIIPSQETNYGTGLLSTMILLATIFSGVLFACFTKVPFTGCLPVIFLFMILNFMAEYKKKNLNISWFFAFAFVIVFFLLSQNNIKESVIPLFICFAGGLCGSLVSFITVKKSSKKKSNNKNKDEAETVVYFDNEADSPRFKNKKNKKNTDEDETVIGTIEL